jgi:hypothetical protein
MFDMVSYRVFVILATGAITTRQNPDPPRPAITCFWLKSCGRFAGPASGHRAQANARCAHLSAGVPRILIFKKHAKTAANMHLGNFPGRRCAVREVTHRLPIDRKSLDGPQPRHIYKMRTFNNLY